MQNKDHKLMEQHHLCKERMCLVKLSETTKSLSMYPFAVLEAVSSLKQTVFFLGNTPKSDANLKA